jgi:hypothetical protein
MQLKLKTASHKTELFLRFFVKQILILAMVVFAFSCTYFNPDVEIPAYIQVDTFSFQSAGPDSTGYPTQTISEVWLYANNLVLGVYELPTGKIPVVADGKTNISIQAGVYTDGVRKTGSITHSTDRMKPKWFWKKKKPQKSVLISATHLRKKSRLIISRILNPATAEPAGEQTERCLSIVYFIPVM